MGLLIALEGLDGAGKRTLTDAVVAARGARGVGGYAGWVGRFGVFGGGGAAGVPFFGAAALVRVYFHHGA